jgi:hypothetical protein
MSIVTTVWAGGALHPAAIPLSCEGISEMFQFEPGFLDVAAIKYM